MPFICYACLNAVWNSSFNPQRKSWESWYNVMLMSKRELILHDSDFVVEHRLRRVHNIPGVNINSAVLFQSSDKDMEFISSYKHCASLQGEFSAGPVKLRAAFPDSCFVPTQDKSVLFMQLLRGWNPWGYWCRWYTLFLHVWCINVQSEEVCGIIKIISTKLQVNFNLLE